MPNGKSATVLRLPIYKRTREERLAHRRTLYRNRKGADEGSVPTKDGPRLNPRESESFRQRLRRQKLAAIGVAVVGVILTILSLSHLAHGIRLVTGAPIWEAWAMAVGVDLGFVALEVAQLCAASPAIGRDLSRFTRPAVLGTLGASALMNALAFGSAATGLMVVPAVLLGLAIPALIYALTQTAFGSAAAH